MQIASKLTVTTTLKIEDAEAMQSKPIKWQPVRFPLVGTRLLIMARFLRIRC